MKKESSLIIHFGKGEYNLSNVCGKMSCRLVTVMKNKHHMWLDDGPCFYHTHRSWKKHRKTQYK